MPISDHCVQLIAVTYMKENTHWDLIGIKHTLAFLKDGLKP